MPKVQSKKKATSKSATDKAEVERLKRVAVAKKCLKDLQAAGYQHVFLCAGTDIKTEKDGAGINTCTIGTGCDFHFRCIVSNNAMKQ